MGAFFHELFRAGLYKRNQGRIARQVTAVVVAIIVGLGAWSWSVWASNQEGSLINNTLVRFLVPFVFAVVGMWCAYRLVNVPNFADFLISVEAEMNKVSWPSRTELIRASIVVLCVIFVLAFVLFAYDLFWRELLQLLRIIE